MSALNANMKKASQEIQAFDCMSHFSKVGNVFKYKVPEGYEFEYDSHSRSFKITFHKKERLFIKKYSHIMTSLYCFLLLLFKHGVLHKGVVDDLIIVSASYFHKTYQPIDQEFTNLIKTRLVRFIKAITDKTPKRPALNVWLEQNDQTNATLNMNELMNAIGKSSHDFRDLAELIERKAFGPHIPQKYIDFLKKHKWNSNRNEITSESNLALFNYYFDIEGGALEQKRQKNTFPLRLYKLLTHNVGHLRYRIPNPPPPIPHVIKGNKISCQLDKDDLIKLGVGKVLNTDLMDYRTSYRVEFTYIDQSKIDEIDYMYQNEFPRETLNFDVNGYTDPINNNQSSTEYNYLICLKVLIAGLVAALATYKTQLTEKPKPKIFSYFTYDELAYFETILKSPGRVKALVQTIGIYSSNSYTDEFKNKVYTLIMSFMYGPRSQLNKQLWSYPLYKDQKITTDDEITDKVPKISQKIIENPDEMMRMLLHEIETSDEDHVMTHLFGYILGIPLSIARDIIIV